MADPAWGVHTEFEVKLLEVDLPSLRRKLVALGAISSGTQNMKRYVYHPHDMVPGSHRWLRLRDDGRKTTLTFKHIKSDKLGDTDELEVEVGDFDSMHLLLTKAGILPTSYQENRRESWELKGHPGVEVCIDWWPLLEPYVEVEGPDEATVMKIVKLLGFTPDQVTTLNTMELYERKGIAVHDHKELKFEGV